MSEPLVLLVEDSPVQQRLIMEAFKAVGYSARFDVQGDAAGAWAAVDAMLRRRPETWPRFAIVDISLPGMSGIDLVDRIRHEGKLTHWPIVMLTSSTDPDDKAESYMAEATAFFAKPQQGESYQDVARAILGSLGRTVGWPTSARRPTPPRGVHSK